MAQDKHYIEMREMQRRMRNLKNGIIEDYSANPMDKKEKKELTMRDLLGKTRNAKKINEFRDMPNIEPELDQQTNTQEYKPEITTQMDMKQEEDKMNAFFADDNVDIKFRVLDVFKDSIFAGGTVGGEIHWVYKVAPSEEESGVKIEYLDSFDPNSEDNKAVIDKIENYYDTFYKYWRDNVLS